MNVEPETRDVTLCIDGHIVNIHEELVRSEAIGGTAQIAIDGATTARLSFAGWRELRFALGVHSHELVVWSARSLHLVDLESGTVQAGFPADEDILFVHSVEVGFLVACESSLRTTDRTGTQVSRLEFPEVIEMARLNVNRVLVADVQGTQRVALLNGLALSALNDATIDSLTGP